MMTHPGMMLASSQPHMINPQPGVMVSQSGYTQGMMASGQPPPQMMQTIGSQPHMGQPMGQPCHMVQPPHMNVSTSQQQPMGSSAPQVQISGQQAFMHQQQQQLGPSQSMFSGGGQPRSPALVPGGPLSQQLTPGGPPSTGGPPSNNPQTPVNPASMNPASQQTVPTPATPQQAPSSVQSSAASQEVPTSVPSIVPPDPISLAKNLILKDLRHSLMELNRSAAEFIHPKPQQSQLDASGGVSHNPLSVNPQSVNPQSVNPQSVNPLSVNPSSVKSMDEPKSVESPDKKIALSPKDAYLNSLNNFLAIVDQIEMNLVLIQEAQKQCTRFDKMFTGELKAVGEMATANYSQHAQGYIESTGRVRNAIDRTLHNLSSQLEKVRAAQANSRNLVGEVKMETDARESIDEMY